VNKPAIPSQSLLEKGPYIPADKTDIRARFERMRTADYFPRESDGMDGDTDQGERDE
jgi:hypothetical protein